MKFYIVDVFAEKAYQGNQLAVCIPDERISQEKMQQIAKEINFSETTFILSGLQQDGGYHVKIFTPDSEIPFAGHPTLGTALIIQRFIDPDHSSQIKLNLEVGQIPVTFNDEEGWMVQNPPTFHAEIDVDTISEILAIDREDIDGEFPVQVVSTGLPSIIVNLKTLDAVNRCKINHQRYDKLLEEIGEANLLVFTNDTVNASNDLHVRVFMFMSGHLEDPATGSANGNLAGYLLEHNVLGSNVISYAVEQGYLINRKSLLKVSATKHKYKYAIQVGGRAFVVAEGKWL
ncbi:PhzF family phenazine biosynthesis protein [Gracilibacillus caseinilyticus]|uniref:PhzF family phenazine biosynthesis protein n=1 Tax=Gracilibacillus caseinilyticus TaxID=2932256 RepID=A0ABY4EWF1_9BACI|nr:PhzF family phenazine biosynthesis protein [Gracilibacillus caseinilyticus]UOQ48741.1 PhzF family phenazine biosynthesis protein [Gracilibacillus caseinilyticus]